MELNEIKKALYQQKPMAYFKRLSKAGMEYDATIIWQFVREIKFLIPLSDIGDAPFTRDMQSQLLIRWIVKPESND